MIMELRCIILNTETFKSIPSSLVDLMTECCVVMRNFTPDLCLLLNDITLDAGSYDRQVEYGFTHPSLDSRASPSYGTLISSMMYCVSTLSSVSVIYFKLKVKRK